MKPHLILIFTVIFALLTVACETEREKKKRLNRKLKELDYKINTLNHKVENLSTEQEKTWVSSAKERFAFLYEMHKYDGKDLENEAYIKKVSFNKKKKGVYYVTVDIRSIHDIRPEFYIYLLDRKGLILGHYRHKKPFFYQNKARAKFGKERKDKNNWRAILFSYRASPRLENEQQ